jgi:hypothetical protein
LRTVSIIQINYELIGNSYANTNKETLTMSSYKVNTIDSCETNNNNNKNQGGSPLMEIGNPPEVLQILE